MENGACSKQSRGTSFLTHPLLGTGLNIVAFIESPYVEEQAFVLENKVGYLNEH